MGKLYDGLGGLATTTGTGTYTISGPITNYIPFSAITDNELLDLVVRGPGNTREVGEYRKIGGASPQLQRVTIYATHEDLDGGTPVSWAAGEKQIYSAASAAAMMTRREINVMLADLDMDGKKLLLSADGTSYVYSPANGTVSVIVDGTQIFDWSFLSSHPFATIKDVASGAVAGPDLYLSRLNPAPAASDVLGRLLFQGRDSGGNDTTYAFHQCSINDPTNGSEDSQIGTYILQGGSQVLGLAVNYNSLLINPNATAGRSIMANKNTTSGLTAGLAYTSDNTLVLSCSSSFTPIHLVKLTSGASGMLACFYNSTHIGGISVGADNSTLTYQTFVGAHPSSLDADFAIEVPLGELPIGSVVCSTDAIHSETQHWLPKWRLPNGRADRGVYGVYAGPQIKPATDPHTGNPSTGVPEDCINALGQWQVLCVGPVRQGDLLVTADELGRACAQEDDLIRSSTIGKCRRTDLREEPRLVPCTLMCG